MRQHQKGKFKFRIPVVCHLEAECLLMAFDLDRHISASRHCDIFMQTYARSCHVSISKLLSSFPPCQKYFMKWGRQAKEFKTPERYCNANSKTLPNDFYRMRMPQTTKNNGPLQEKYKKEKRKRKRRISYPIHMNVKAIPILFCIGKRQHMGGRKNYSYMPNDFHFIQNQLIH